MEPAPWERDDPGRLPPAQLKASHAAMEPAPWERDDSAAYGTMQGMAETPQWSPLLGSGMTLHLPRDAVDDLHGPQWSPLLGSGMT